MYSAALAAAENAHPNTASASSAGAQPSLSIAYKPRRKRGSQYTEEEKRQRKNQSMQRSRKKKKNTAAALKSRAENAGQELRECQQLRRPTRVST